MPRADPDRLVYRPDSGPGITRRRRGRGFSYHAPDGTVIRDREERRRIEALAVPPAYSAVWINPDPRGHLQATGRDARGRKQYRYHPAWQRMRARRKFEGLAAFGRCLPRIRAEIASGLAAPTGSRELAVAAVLAILDRAAVRIGSPDYARDNDSYGATTMLAQHARFDAHGVELTFPGKRGALVSRYLQGRRLHRALQAVHDLPGAQLMSWEDGEGQVHAVHSEDVNAVLRRVCGRQTTAKTFRTWHGTHAAFCVARRAERLRVADLAAAAAERLGNTPAIARSSYIHPDVIDLASLPDGERKSRLDSLHPVPASRLRAEEGRLIAFLEGKRGG